MSEAGSLAKGCYQIRMKRTRAADGQQIWVGSRGKIKKPFEVEVAESQKHRWHGSRQEAPKAGNPEVKGSRKEERGG